MPMITLPRELAARGARLLLPLLPIALVGIGDADGAELTISWTDNSGGTAATRIERRLGADTTFTTLAEVPPGVTVYVDRAVSPGTTYCYRAFARRDNRASPYSSVVCGSPPLAGLDVTLSKIGSGYGTVTSAPPGIDCGAACSATYPAGVSVTLSATPRAGSTFGGWSGGGCGGTESCVVAGNAPVTVTATFSRAAPTLTAAPGAGPPGTEFTVTLANWAGGSQDWLAVAPTGSGDRTVGVWTYVASLPASGGARTWRVTLTQPGDFEARLYPDGGYARAATSAAFTVASPALPATSAIVSVSPLAGPSGGEFVVSVVDWSGGPYDWLTIAPVGVGDGVYGPWVYVAGLPASGGARSWRVRLNALGAFEARLYPGNGFTRGATSPAFVVGVSSSGVTAP
jgi:hypothetical protein